MMNEIDLRVRAVELAVAFQGKLSDASELMKLAEIIYQFISENVDNKDE